MSYRIEYIDMLKGVAIICVVMGHVVEKGMNLTQTPFNAFYWSFHMPLFMFLSGIFSMKEFCNNNFAECRVFLKKKLLRIMMPFFVVGGGIFSITRWT